jgi:hypothetical protein
VTNPFEDEFTAEQRQRPSVRGGVLGLSVGVLFGVIVAGAILGALILVFFIFVPNGFGR